MNQELASPVNEAEVGGEAPENNCYKARNGIGEIGMRDQMDSRSQNQLPESQPGWPPEVPGREYFLILSTDHRGMRRRTKRIHLENPPIS